MTSVTNMETKAAAMEAASDAFANSLLDLRNPSKVLELHQGLIQAHIDWLQSVVDAYMAQVERSVEGLR